MRISDWSSDVCSSDLAGVEGEEFVEHRGEEEQVALTDEAVLVHGQFGTYAAHRQPAMQAIDVLVGDVSQAAEAPPADVLGVLEIGRASCRARACQYVSISVGAVSLKQTEA